MSATSSIWLWYVPYRGLSDHNGPSGSSAMLIFSSLRHSLSRSSMGAVFLMYYWRPAVSSWIVGLTPTSHCPPFLHLVYNLRMLDFRVKPSMQCKEFSLL